MCIYAVVTANLSMEYDDIYELAMAAILHDVGKCKVPLSILNKPGKLTTEEFEVMKRHAISGLEIASQLTGLSEKIARIICQHHEKWDGSGYPLGLNSYDIELGARIISIADVYDALTANRVYRKRFMPHEATEYLIPITNPSLTHAL